MHNDWREFIKKIPTSGPPVKMAINIAELPNNGIIKISGVDAKKFLQGQLTCDVNNIASDHSQLGAHCNQQGRIISLFYLAEFQNTLYLCMPRNMITIAISALKKYSIFFKVDITDMSSELITIGMTHLETIPIKLSADIISFLISSHPHRHLLIGNQTDLLKQLQPLQDQLLPLTENIWNTLNMSDGIPSLHPETTGVFLPHELNLDKLNAISFEKGCYTGQEIIARMHYRGKLKTRMHLARITSTSQIIPGSDIFFLENQRPHIAGKIVDACLDENNWYNALITLEESSKDHQRLFLASNTNTYFTLSN